MSYLPFYLFYQYLCSWILKTKQNKQKKQRKKHTTFLLRKNLNRNFKAESSGRQGPPLLRELLALPLWANNSVTISPWYPYPVCLREGLGFIGKDALKRSPSTIVLSAVTQGLTSQSHRPCGALMGAWSMPELFLVLFLEPLG